MYVISLQVRRYLAIKKYHLQNALEYNIDPRRCGLTSLTFVSSINQIRADEVLLIVQVVTANPNVLCITPKISNEYFVEYVVYVQ